jgi:hypothetical protein
VENPHFTRRQSKTAKQKRKLVKGLVTSTGDEAHRSLQDLKARMELPVSNYCTAWITEAELFAMLEFPL